MREDIAFWSCVAVVAALTAASIFSVIVVIYRFQ